MKLDNTLQEIDKSIIDIVDIEFDWDGEERSPNNKSGSEEGHLNPQNCLSLWKWLIIT